MKTRVQAKIVGRVQGVGFRPTVYRYATELGLAGFVRNDPTGVTLEVEGDERAVNEFFRQLEFEPPRQAVITGVEKQPVTVRDEECFAVVESQATGAAEVHISPDLATCDDCLRELNDPADRRYEFPFINCTNCGPRFTITRELPYDRANTSMTGFQMCPECEREYHSPADRRFHAQPDACEKCGPRLSMPVSEAVRLLREGKIVAIKSLGGFHLACTMEAMPELRGRKHRPHKPFAVMFRDIEAVKQWCEVGELEEAELLSEARPVVILKSKPSAASPDFPSLGAFLPYTPIHHLLMQHFDALVMTSGNLAEEPIASEETELPAVADAVLNHDRPIVHKCDDSVLRIVNGRRQFFRRARGFAPSAIRFADDCPHILATGGELKSTFCLARNGFAFLSQHIGDLKEFKTHEYFTHEINEWQRLMRVEPVAVAHDLHPGYLSSRYAEHHPAMLKIGVQHHHAHIASVMAEHNLRGKVIGVALDGTGYGTDGTIWGGEFLVASHADFERVAHFKPYRLPGGDKAIQEPWRMAASVCVAEGLAGDERIRQMVTTGFNSPVTSSAGRLFDAVAAMLGLCDVATYEAQAAIRLEAVVDAAVRDLYPMDLVMTARPWQLDFGKTIRAIATDHRRHEPVGVIAAKFHNTVAHAIGVMCRLVRNECGLSMVALSGGVFQNQFLLNRLVEDLERHEFAVFTNTLVPPNDGGLALGQVTVAAERMQQSCV